MKKLISLLAICILTLIGGIVFAACDTSSSSGAPEYQVNTPTLEKSSFSIRCASDGKGVMDYDLNWRSQYATKYKVVCDGVETVVHDMRFSLNGYSADEVHTVTVTALGQKDTQSEPVEVKFKGTKLDMPINVRLYGTTNSFGWKECEGTSTYAISCEELDLDIMTSRPVGTGKIKSINVYNNSIDIYDLRSIFEILDLYALQSFRVQALPYNGNLTVFDYKDDTDVLEFSLPSDLSEQSVNFYLGQMSNPSNVRWDFEGFEDHPGYATVKWDSVSSDYRYKVLVHYPDGHSGGIVTQKGETEGSVGFDYRMDTGDYTVTIESMCDDFVFIGEDREAKWVTYMFYMPTKEAESVAFRINQTAMQAPANVRIVDDQIMWDAVDNAGKYTVEVRCGEKVLYETSYTAQLSLQEVAGSVYFANDDLNGYYDIRVLTDALEAEIVSLENGIPVINTYKDSEYSEPLIGKLKLEVIPSVQNVRIDYENKTISWDAHPEASKYEIMFQRANGGGYGTTINDDTQYSWNSDISDIVKITIKAICEYSYTVEDGVVTVKVPSTYTMEI